MEEGSHLVLGERALAKESPGQASGPSSLPKCPYPRLGSPAAISCVDTHPPTLSWGEG